MAASTNKLYVWGMNDEFKTLDNFYVIKPKNQIEKFTIVNKKIEIIYEDQEKSPPTIFSTIKRKFILESHKVS